MAQPRLRLYYGPAENGSTAVLRDTGQQRDTVTVSLGDVFPLLAEAIHSERTWLRDFEDDEVTISMDLPGRV